jgi:uncharacterized membrane protein YcaP (DUF421 family)
MYSGGQVLIGIAARTAVIYGVVLLGMRLSGKREVGQMTPFDLTLILLISNAVQNAMTGPVDTSLLGGVVAASTLLLLNYLIAEVSGGNRRFRKFVEGQPSLLVHGQVIEAHMAKEHVSMDELPRALRKHGIGSYHDEVDGSISCMKYDDIKPTASTHLARRRFIQKHE